MLEDDEALKMELELLFDITAQIAPPIFIPDTPDGTRVVVHVTGGKFEGPRVKGAVLASGADWFLVRADGDCGRELAGGRSFNIHHIHPVGCRSWAWDWASRETDEPANLVIPQAGPGSGREVSPSELPLNLGLCRNCRCVRPGEKDWTTVF